MNSQQIELVRRSFLQVVPIAPQAAAIFYQRLFELDPALRPLFSGDMVRQGELLMKMLGAAVGLLNRPAELDDALARLGARHAGYGVQDAHYDTVGRALFDTLAMGLGPAFTAEVRAAWTALYGHVSLTMRAAAALPA
jgi:hemoglobin-like flavoprotein